MKGTKVRVNGVVEREMSDGFTDVKLVGSQSKKGIRIKTSELLKKKLLRWK